MSELIDWYWNFGIRRGYDEADPDRALRKIGVGEWLDPLVTILDRCANIRENISQKACIALWGASQTGKSTMLSAYVDGVKNDGSDSALTWTRERNIRFSTPKEGIAAVPDSTLIFNPYNHGSDASGLVTRYVLRSDTDVPDKVNPQFPVEIKLTTRAQLIQSLSLGYQSECLSENSERYDKAKLDSILTPYLGNGESHGHIDQDAYFLLKDIADVIEVLQGNELFNDLFRRKEWSVVRRELVSAPGLLSSVSQAEKLLNQLFWNGNPTISKVYRGLAAKLRELSGEWKNCRILASPEVGALLLDIASFKTFEDPLKPGEAGYSVKDKISRLTYERVGNEIHFMIGDAGGNEKVSGEAFCRFQALCSELVVPLRKEQLEKRPSPDGQSNDLLTLLQKCDILDFPGVSNFNAGNVKGEENKPRLDTEHCTDTELFCRMFKEGKTQCFVYNYSERFGIDAFMVMVRVDRPTSNTSLLNAGIGRWIHSFDKEWKRGEILPLPIFMDMTFFASLLNVVGASGVGNGLKGRYEFFSALNWVNSKGVRFFPTTYPQYPDGVILCGSKETTVPQIMAEKEFVQRTGISKAATLEAPYAQDGGVSQMLRCIAKELTPQKRKEKCGEILERDKKKFVQLLEKHLPPKPTDNNLNAEQRRKELQDCLESLENAVANAEAKNDLDCLREYAFELKQMLEVKPDDFDLLPYDGVTTPTLSGTSQYQEHMSRQITKWYNERVGQLEEGTRLPWDLSKRQILLAGLRDYACAQVDELVRLLRENVGMLTTQEQASSARFLLALLLSNILKTGHPLVESQTVTEERNPKDLDSYLQVAVPNQTCTREYSPYFKTTIQPLLKLLDEMASGDQGMVSRPPQPGDQELQALLERATSTIFTV